jgi:hypothetical protein
LRQEAGLDPLVHQQLLDPLARQYRPLRAWLGKGFNLGPLLRTLRSKGPLDNFAASPQVADPTMKHFGLSVEPTEAAETFQITVVLAPEPEPGQEFTPAAPRSAPAQDAASAPPPPSGRRRKSMQSWLPEQPQQTSVAG